MVKFPRRNRAVKEMNGMARETKKTAFFQGAETRLEKRPLCLRIRGNYKVMAL
jgi:hypothetical protein